jgi:hypothetical protein
MRFDKGPPNYEVHSCNLHIFRTNVANIQNFDALLFRVLATLRLEVPVFDMVDELHWQGPYKNSEEQCQRLKRLICFVELCRQHRQIPRAQTCDKKLRHESLTFHF